MELHKNSPGETITAFLGIAGLVLVNVFHVGQDTANQAVADGALVVTLMAPFAVKWWRVWKGRAGQTPDGKATS